jgi:predicted  nucleic acid-binding Zn-ribbon protein
MNLSNENHETTKIPDFILLNRSKGENEKLQKEIIVLQEEIKNLKERISCIHSDMKLTKKEAMYKNLIVEHNKACNVIHEQREKIKELMYINMQLNKALV